MIFFPFYCSTQTRNDPFANLAIMATNITAISNKKAEETIDSGYESDTEEYVPEEETNPIQLKNHETIEQLQQR